MNSQKQAFALGRTNFILLAVGMVVVIIGFILMSGNGSTAEAFDPAIFSARRIKVAPVVCLFGYLFMVYAIMHRPRKAREEAAQADATEPRETTQA